jgi:hypothetical protein
LVIKAAGGFGNQALSVKLPGDKVLLVSSFDGAHWPSLVHDRLG